MACLHCTRLRVRFPLAAVVILMMAAFVFPMLAQDGGAVLVGSFNLEALPNRDLAIPCGAYFFLFGDTNPNTPRWQPNTGAWRIARDILQPVNGDGALWWPDADAEAAAQVIDPDLHASSVPTGCLALGGTFYAYYMDTALNTGHDFQVVSSGIAVSYDGGTVWTKHRLFNGDGWQGQAAFAVTGDGYAYLLMSPGGRVGDAYLARTDDLLNVERYTFWNGGDFTPNMDAAAPVIRDQVGEASICFDGEQFLVAYMSPAYDAVIMRTAPALTGSWSEPRVLVSWTDVHGSYSPQWIRCGAEFLLSHYENNLINGVTWPRYNVFRWSIRPDE